MNRQNSLRSGMGRAPTGGGLATRSLTAPSGPRSTPVVHAPPNGGLPSSHPNPIDRSQSQSPSNTLQSNVNGIAYIAPQSQPRLAAERGDIRNSGTPPSRERRQLPPRIHRANTVISVQMDPAPEQTAMHTANPNPSRPLPSRILSTGQHDVNHRFNNDANPHTKQQQQQQQQHQQQMPTRRNSSFTRWEPIHMVSRDPGGQAGSTVTRPPRSSRITGLVHTGSSSFNLGESSRLELAGSVTPSLVNEYSIIGTNNNLSERNGSDRRTALRPPGAPIKNANRVSLNPTPQVLEPNPRVPSNERLRPPRRISKPTNPPPPPPFIEEIPNPPLARAPAYNTRPLLSIVQVTPQDATLPLVGLAGSHVSVLKQQDPATPFNTLVLNKSASRGVLHATTPDEATGADLQLAPHESEDRDEGTEDEYGVMRLGKGAKVKTNSSGGLATAKAARGVGDPAEAQRAFAWLEEKIKVVGKELKDPVEAKAPLLPNVVSSRQSVLTYNTEAASLAVNGVRRKVRVGQDGDDSGARTEEMDDVYYFDSNSKMNMVPPHVASGKGHAPVPSEATTAKSTSALNQAVAATAASAENVASTAALEDLRVQLEKEKAQGARLRQALELSKGDIAPVLDLLQEKEKQLELFKEVVLAKSTMDQSRDESDDSLNKLAMTKNAHTQKRGQLEGELETALKEEHKLQTRFTVLNAAIKFGTEKDLASGEMERVDAECAVDALLDEREAPVRQIEDKSKGLATADSVLARLAKEVEDIKKREQESIRRLQEAESRVHATEAALRKAEVTANYSVNEVKTKGMVSSEIEDKLKSTMKDFYFAQAREAEVGRQLKEAESRLKFSEDALMESEMALENAVVEIEALKLGQEGIGKVMRDEIDTLNNDLDHLALELDEKNTEVEKAHDTIGDLDIKINGLESDLELARDEIDSNAKTIDDLQSQLNAARAEKTLFVKQIMELKQAHTLELEIVVHQAQENGQNMEALIVKCQTWESRIGDLEEALALAELERDDLKGRCVEMEQDLDDIIRTNNEKIETHSVTLQELGGEADSRIKELHHELKVAKNNGEAAKKRVEELEAAHLQSDAATSVLSPELEEAVETAKFERDETKERVVELEEKLMIVSISSSADAELTQQILALEESLAAMMAEKNNWQSEAAELEGQMEELWGQKEGLIERVTTLEKGLKDAQEALAKGVSEAGRAQDLTTSADYAAVEQARDVALEEARSLKHELDELRKRKLEGVDVNLKGELAALVKERDVAQAEVGTLKADIQELETMFEEAQAEIGSLRTKPQELSYSGEDFEMVAQLEQELDDVMAEVDDLRQKLLAAESASASVKHSATSDTAKLEQELDAEKFVFHEELKAAEASAAGTSARLSSTTEVAELENELEEATTQITELHNRLEVAEAASAETTKESDFSEERDNLEIHLANAKVEIQELRVLLAQSSGAGSTTEDAAKISYLEAQLEDSHHKTEELFARVQELESLASYSNHNELEKLMNEEEMGPTTSVARNKSLTTEVASLHERLARHTELSKIDVDTQVEMDKLEGEIEELKSELDNNLKRYNKLEAHYIESENVNKELNHLLNLADQEIGTLHRQMDDAYTADTMKELEETKIQLAAYLDKSQNDGSGTSAGESGTNVDALVKERVKAREDEFERLEVELRSQIEDVEEQAREREASLIQQLQDQEEDAKETRETLVTRLRQQESEATTLRENLSQLQADFAEAMGNLKTIEKDFTDFRLTAQGLEKRHLERVELVESSLDQTYAEIKSLRAQIIQSAKDQGFEPPTFNPLEPLPPVNYDDTEELYDAPKTGFLSSLWKGRRPTVTSPKDDKKKELPGRVVATPQPIDETRTVSSPTPSTNAGKDGKNNKQSTGILSSLWGGRGKNPEGSESTTATQTSTMGPDDPVPSEPTTTATTSDVVANAKDVIAGADEDDVPQQPPSKFLASIWGATTKLKRTESEIM